jgi:hypothetical protein
MFSWPRDLTRKNLILFVTCTGYKDYYGSIKYLPKGTLQYSNYKHLFTDLPTISTLTAIWNISIALAPSKGSVWNYSCEKHTATIKLRGEVSPRYRSRISFPSPNPELYHLWGKCKAYPRSAIGETYSCSCDQYRICGHIVTVHRPIHFWLLGILRRMNQLVHS